MVPNRVCVGLIVLLGWCGTAFGEIACCLPDGSCIVVDVTTCAAIDGMDQPRGRGCEAAVCPMTGSCCLVGGICEQATFTDCDALGGSYQGDATNCIITICPNSGFVRAHQTINALEGGFNGPLAPDDQFGRSITPIGDIDGDGVTDIAVGAPNAGIPVASGAIWVLLLNADGTVKAEQEIRRDVGGFDGFLGPFDHFGASLAFLGDLDGDGVADVAAGAPGDDDGGFDRGAVWILFLNADGTVKAHQKIGRGAGFTGNQNADQFGFSLAWPGDLDGDGLADLVVGAVGSDDQAGGDDDDGRDGVAGGGDDDGGSDFGAVWVLFLNSDGTIREHQKISQTDGGFTGNLDSNDAFGSSATTVGDIDDDGVEDLIVGAIGDDDGAPDAGAIWLLFMNIDGTVKAHQKISSTEGGFTGDLDSADHFGFAVTTVGDLDGDGRADIAVGAPDDDDGATDAGAIWILLLKGDGTVQSEQKISATEGDFQADLLEGDVFGTSVAPLGDLEGDGVADLAIGAGGDLSLGGDIDGALYIVFLEGQTQGFQHVQPPVEAAGAGDFEASGNLDPFGAGGVAGAGANFTEDVVIVVPGQDQIQIFFNLGSDATGGWLGLVPGPPIDVGSNPTSVTLGLFNGDNVLDIAVAHSGTEELWILVNDGTANFTPSILTLTPDPSLMRRTVVAEDVNEDGHTDLIIASAGLDTVQVLLNSVVETVGGAPSFVPGPSVDLPPGSAPWSIEPENIDGDRCMDLVVANAGSGTVAVLMGAPGGGFKLTAELPTYGGPVDTAVADFNCDGLLDIASADNAGWAISTFMQEADGSFTAAFPPVFLSSQPLGVVGADFNGDSAPDIAVVLNNSSSEDVSVHLNEPSSGGGCTGDFALPLLQNPDGQALFIVEIDLDGDGVPDLVTVNESSTFESGGSVTGVLTSFCPSDVNGNGVTDVDDLVGVILLYGTANPDVDVNDDGTVNVDDLVQVVLGFGECG